MASVMRAGEADGWPSHLASAFAQSVEELCEQSGLEAAAVLDPALPHSQRYFSEAVDMHAFASLLADAPLRDRAHLSGRGAGAWLGVIPRRPWATCSPLLSSPC